MSRSDIDDLANIAAAEGREVRRDLRQTMLSGIAITVPFFITVLVLVWVFGLVTNALAPLVSVLDVFGPTDGMSTLLVEVIAGGIVVGTIFAVGFAAQYGPDTGVSDRIDTLMEDLPGIGSIYTSVDRMSQVMASNTDSFQDVKIVEFPREGAFMLAFLTADAPAEIESAAEGEELITVFVPMSPNPVMGGHLLNLPPEQVFDVDLTVEEGMQAVMTTGMAIDKTTFEDEGARA